MNSAYYVGNFREDGLNGPNRGWIVGKFIENAPRKNEDVAGLTIKAPSDPTAKKLIDTSNL